MNDALGRKMRFCEWCHYPLGILRRHEYVARFVHKPGICCGCGNPARMSVQERQWRAREEEKDAEFRRRRKRKWEGPSKVMGRSIIFRHTGGKR